MEGIFSLLDIGLWLSLLINGTEYVDFDLLLLGREWFQSLILNLMTHLIGSWKVWGGKWSCVLDTSFLIFMVFLVGYVMSILG